jgi:hypothetical protein
MSKHIKLFFFACAGAVVLALGGCRGDGSDRPDAPDVSHIPVEIQLQRFDRDFFALDTSQLEAQLPVLAQRYPDMLPLFLGEMIRDQTNPNETPVEAARGFLTAPQVRHLYDTVQQVYADLSWLERDLTQLFRYYRYYFPDKPTPSVVTMVSEFASDAFTAGDNLAGIGLDMFLGENYPGYNPEIFPGYIRHQFHRDYIPVRLAKAVVQNNLAGEPSGDRLLDLMLHNGKILYITSLLLPATPDSMLMGYTREQIEGSQANEAEVWARLLGENLLYSSDFTKYRKLVTPSPNAPVVFQEAPGEIGNWVGWQIVRAYVRRHPNTSPQELLNLRDAQKFLEASRYKPKRD